MLQWIAPSDVVVQTIDKFDDYPLLPEEKLCLGKVTDRRRIEFATGRECAKNALRSLGLTPTAILIGNGREPIWPKDIIGSITHCAGYCAAVATKSPWILSIGIDAEENLPLPEGVLDLIAIDQEQAVISNMNQTSIHFDRLLFSAKEAVFKAWYTLTREWLEFSDCCIDWDPCQTPRVLLGGKLHGEFVAQLERPCATANRLIYQFQGRYIVSPSHLATLVHVW